MYCIYRSICQCPVRKAETFYINNIILPLHQYQKGLEAKQELVRCPGDQPQQEATKCPRDRMATGGGGIPKLQILGPWWGILWRVLLGGTNAVPSKSCSLKGDYCCLRQMEGELSWLHFPSTLQSHTSASHRLNPARNHQKQCLGNAALLIGQSRMQGRHGSVSQWQQSCTWTQKYSLCYWLVCED